MSWWWGSHEVSNFGSPAARPGCKPRCGVLVGCRIPGDPLWSDGGLLWGIPLPWIWCQLWTHSAAVFGLRRRVTEGSRLYEIFASSDTSSIDMFFSLIKNDAMIRAALIAAWQVFVQGSLFWVPLAPVSNRGIQKSHYFLCFRSFPQKQSSTL